MERNEDYKTKFRYRIKYEDVNGDCHIEVVYAHHYTDIYRRLSHPVREVYWWKKENEPHLPKIKTT